MASYLMPCLGSASVATHRASCRSFVSHFFASCARAWICVALLRIARHAMALHCVAGRGRHDRAWQDMVEVAQDVSSYCMIGLSWLFFASLHFLLFAWSRGVYPWMICGLQIWCLIGKKYSDRGRGGVFPWMICGPGLPRLPDACLGKRACRCREWAQEGG